MYINIHRYTHTNADIDTDAQINTRICTKTDINTGVCAHT